MPLEDLHAFRAKNNLREKLNRAAAEPIPDFAPRAANG
jgi:hypothetical protein